MRHGRIFLLLVTSLVVFDQGTKIAIRQSLPVDDAGWAASCTFDYWNESKKVMYRHA